ncbi:protein broad-minded [Plakobranchus ocellatus]|uniref:Protein broad-minded n=1 Tax=Plakobranchus ocellatus TaxID=259542 RepID=A0AAV4BNJ7_9GAST|nr:protein broad-minded [Plakobranchus ocellatus]
MRGLEGEDLKKGLRELIISWETIIREAGSLEAAEDTLLHLEENDENFHKHDFVRALKRKLEECLSPLIDDELEKYSTTGHIDSGSHETLVNQIIDHIIQSKQYGELKRRLGRNVGEAVDSLLTNFDAEFGIGRIGGGTEGLDPRKTPFVTDDEEVSSFNSLYDQGSVMLFNQDYLKGIADNLGKTKNPSTRREAMQKLNQIISGDIHNKHWPLLRKNLMDVMSDADEQLSDMSLKFVAKSFTCTSHHTSQVYILLMEFLCNQFTSSNSAIPLVKNGLDCTNKAMIKLLKAFRLMVEFQQEAPNYWVRYPLVYLEEVVESSLNLLALQVAPQFPNTKLCPLHFVAVLDPKAQWFIKWMHGNYSRSELLEHLKKYRVIVETALRYCLDFSASRKSPYDGMSEISEALSKVSLADSGKRLFYSGPELEYSLFIHSLSFLGRLLCFEKGRSFFPIRLKEKQVPVNIKQLLKALVLLIVDPGVSTTTSRRTEKNSYESTYLVSEVFKSLCSTEAMCSASVCKDDIMNTLLSPVAQLLDGATDHPVPNEMTLLYVADILCIVASSTRGRRHLIHGEGKGLLSRTKSSAAHLIAEFTKKALSEKLSPPCPSAVTGAYLYVCRQLYNTCEGLLVLSQYELHTCIAQTWRKLQDSEKGGSSTVSSVKADDSDKYKDSYSICQCQRSLLCIQPCYIRALLSELWSSLECGPQDTPVFTPKTWPVDPIDRLSQKHFIRLVNILSAFPAVYELIRGEALPGRETYGLRDVPETVTALIDRIIIVDSPAKIHSLFNYEQSCTFGLRVLSAMVSCLDTYLLLQSRVLSAMVSCLDTYLLLQSQYKFQEFLLQEQDANKMEGSDLFIKDALSLERNYVLVKTFMIGGPSERTLPSRTLEEDKSGNIKSPTLFSSYPIPREYQPNIAGRSAMKQENDLSKFLGSGRPEKKPSVWVEKCRDLFYKMVTSKPDQAKGNLLQQVLEQTVVHQCHMQEEAIFHLFDFSGTDSTIKNFKLSPLQLLGIKTAVRYGIHLKVINTSSESTENLTQLVKLTGCFLRQQQRSLKSSLRFVEGSYPGFDWFTATIFLIFNGHAERAWNFLHKFSSLGASGYLWMARLHASLLPISLLSSGIPPLFSSTAHNIELVLQIELPLVASAFTMSGYTPSQICFHWLSQCFWNYLDWLDIVHYVTVCVCLGVDYQVYLCVAILKHLQESILSHMQTQDLIIFLKEEAIRNFHVLDHIRFMKDLETKYRKIVLADMMNISKP